MIFTGYFDIGEAGTAVELSAEFIPIYDKTAWNAMISGIEKCLWGECMRKEVFFFNEATFTSEVCYSRVIKMEN